MMSTASDSLCVLMHALPVLGGEALFERFQLRLDEYRHALDRRAETPGEREIQPIVKAAATPSTMNSLQARKVDSLIQKKIALGLIIGPENVNMRKGSVLEARRSGVLLQNYNRQNLYKCIIWDQPNSPI